LKLVAALLLVVTLLGTGTSFLVQQGHAQNAAPAAAAAADEPKPADAPPAGAKTDLYGDALPEGALARMGTLRWRHGGPVNFVGFTEGGKHLVTCSSDGYFRVWDVANGKEVRKFGKPAQVDPNTGQMIFQAGAAMAMPANFGPQNVVMSP